jgi:hypothetical protein
MEAAEWLRAFLEEETAPARRTYDPAKDRPFAKIGEPTDPPLWTEAPLTGDDAERPVAFIQGDTLTALEVIDELDFQPTITWPEFKSVSDVLDLCGSALYYRVQLLEAKRLRVDQDPEVQRKINDRLRIMFWRAYTREKLNPELTPEDDELRALYEERFSNYSLPERRRFVLVNTPTRELAEQAADLFREGYVPSSVVQKLGVGDPDFEITPDTTSGWVVRGQHPALDPVLFELPEGEVSDPIPERGRFSVLRVEQISPAHDLTFEEVREALSQKSVEKRRAKRMAEMAAKAREGLDVWIDHDAILGMRIDTDAIARGREKKGKSF